MIPAALSALATFACIVVIPALLLAAWGWATGAIHDPARGGSR